MSFCHGAVSVVRPSSVHNSRKSLFLLESWGDLIQTFTQCSPGWCVYRVSPRCCHLSYLRFYSRFKVLSHTLRQTLHVFLLNYVGDLTQIHTQCFCGPCFALNAISPKPFDAFYSNSYTMLLWILPLQGVCQVAPPFTVGGYKVISDIFTKITISPKVLNGFHSNLYTRFTRFVCI